MKSINGVAIDYVAADHVRRSAATSPSRLFLGNLTFGIGAGGQLTLTRANGSDLGSFLDEGFATGQFIRIAGAGAGDSGQFYVYASPTPC